MNWESHTLLQFFLEAFSNEALAHQGIVDVYLSIYKLQHHWSRSWLSLLDSVLPGWTRDYLELGLFE